MMTIVTRVKLKEGCEPRWDAAMRERLEAARTQAGWIAGQVAIPIEALEWWHEVVTDLRAAA